MNDTYMNNKVPAEAAGGEVPLRDFFREASSAFLGGAADEALVDQLSRNASLRQVRMKEYLVTKGAPQTNMFFLFSGVLRCYSLDGNGREITNRFIYRRGEPGIAAASLKDQEPALDWVQALTDSEVVTVPLDEISDVLTAYPKMLDVFTDAMSQSYQHIVELSSMRQMGMVDRCRWLHRNFPELEDLVQKQYLASYLGMDKSVYSRSMRQVHEEEKAY